VTALLADQTRDVVRTKAMAMVGASIGLMFAISLVLSPLLNSLLGLSGLFVLTAVLAVSGIAVVLWWVPPEPAKHAEELPARAGREFAGGAAPTGLVRLNFGVFMLHAVQLAMWVALPAMLVQAGLPKDHHWWVYLPAVLGSFFVMGATLFPLEKRGYLRAVFLSSVGLIALVQIGLLAVASTVPTITVLACCCLYSSAASTFWRPASPAWHHAWHRRVRGHGAGCVQQFAVAGLFAGGALGGWLGQGRTARKPVWRVRAGHAGLAGGSLAHAGARAAAAHPAQSRDKLCMI
jgi:MFS family permease